MKAENLTDEQFETYKAMCNYQDKYVKEETHWMLTVIEFSTRQLSNQLELTNLEFADVLHLFIDRE